MSKPILVYFPWRGLGEIVRLVFAAANADYETIVVEVGATAEWKASGKLAFGQFPLLQDDGFNLSQSGAIARYLARKYSLYGDLKTGAIGDAILDGFKDIVAKLVPIIFGSTKDEEKISEFKSTILPTFLRQIEQILEHNNNGDGWVSGDRFSFADITLFNAVDTFVVSQNFSSAEEFPKLFAHYERVSALPVMAAYLNSEKRYPPSKYF